MVSGYTYLQTSIHQKISYPNNPWRKSELLIPISQVLFNLFLSDLIRDLFPLVPITSFADDLFIYTSNVSIDSNLTMIKQAFEVATSHNNSKTFCNLVMDIFNEKWIKADIRCYRRGHHHLSIIFNDPRGVIHWAWKFCRCWSYIVSRGHVWFFFQIHPYYLSITYVK